MIGGAMTDPKGDRSAGPAEQADPDLFLHVVERRDDGVVLRGAKAHQTGCINSHWIVVMPTMRMRRSRPRLRHRGGDPGGSSGR